MIRFEDISVIVQGPIIGSPGDKTENRHTYQCLKSIRKHLPGATIILSTWEGMNVDDLDYDELIKSVDPGYTKILDSIPGNIRNDASNRQIISTLSGLKLSKTKYSMKIRSDLVFKNTNFLKYFEKFTTLPFDHKYKILNQRVLMLTTINPNRRWKHPFSMSDWFYFGLTEDIKNIFDIPLISEKNLKGPKTDGLYSINYNYSIEQYLWFGFLRKYRDIPFNHFMDVSGNNIELSERYLTNNSIIISAWRAGVNSLKYPWASYAQIPCLSYSGLYTYNDYKRLLNKYAPNHLLIIPNPIEEILYATVYPLRFWVKKKNPRLHDFIAKTVNPRNH